MTTAMTKTINMHDAKSNLSRLVEGARAGEPFIIARAGKPLAKVVAFEAQGPKRMGFMKGHGQIPADFDQMGAAEIQALFEG